eukprot:1425053-Prymnesium_polylepis.1
MHLRDTATWSVHTSLRGQRKVDAGRALLSNQARRGLARASSGSAQSYADLVDASLRCISDMSSEN